MAASEAQRGWNAKLQSAERWARRGSPTGSLHPLVSVYQAAAGRSAKTTSLSLVENHRGLSAPVQHHTHVDDAGDAHPGHMMQKKKQQPINFLN